MKIRKHYIKFTGNINNTYIIEKAAIRSYVSKQLKQCNFILKCKSYNSLVLQARTTNANKMLVTRVTTRPAFFIANPTFCISQTEQFDHRCSNFNIAQVVNKVMCSDLQKKKKVNTCLTAGFVQFSA